MLYKLTVKYYYNTILEIQLLCDFDTGFLTLSEVTSKHQEIHGSSTLCKAVIVAISISLWGKGLEHSPCDPWPQRG